MPGRTAGALRACATYPRPTQIANPAISCPLYGLTHALENAANAREGRSSKNRLDRTELLWPELGGSRATARGRRVKLGLDMKILLPYDDYKVTVLSRRTPVKYEFTHHW